MGERIIRGPEPVGVDRDAHLTTGLWRRADDDHEVMRHHDGSDWTTITWRQLAERVREVSAGLVASGLAPGDAVAVMSPTRLEWTVTDLAILAAGGVTVPIYSTDSVEQCAWVLSDSSARLAVAAGDEHAGRLEQARGDAPDLGEVLVMDRGAMDELAGRGGEGDRSEVERRCADLDLDAVASIVYTSGTTGRPKGCVLTHGNMLWTTRQSVAALRPLFEGPAVSTLLFLPLAHIFTRLIQFGCLESDTEIAYARSMDTLREDITDVRPSFLLAVPRVFEKIHSGARKRATGIKGRVFDLADDAAQESAERDGGGLATKAKLAVADRLVYERLRESLGGRVQWCVSGGAPLSEDLARFFNAAGINVLQGYGLTETSAPATVEPPDAPRVGTVGRPLPGVAVRLAEDSGEVLVRGPNVFRGYHRNEEKTAESMTADGWFRTGDLGDIDDDGYLRITGRAKDLIVTAGGKNVAPEPLEERMRDHPLISQPVVVGDGRPFVAALITLDEEELAEFARERGLEGTPEELRRHEDVRREVEQAVQRANEMVSRAESIREFRILDRDFTQERRELTPTMKPRRRDIIEHFAAQIDGIYG